MPTFGPGTGSEKGHLAFGLAISGGTIGGNRHLLPSTSPLKPFASIPIPIPTSFRSRHRLSGQGTPLVNPLCIRLLSGGTCQNLSRRFTVRWHQLPTSSRRCFRFSPSGGISCQPSDRASSAGGTICQRQDQVHRQVASAANLQARGSSPGFAVRWHPLPALLLVC